MRDKSGFSIISSNDLGVLASICAQITKVHPLKNPLAREQVLVMSLGMKTYLSQELAKENGIFACVDFKQTWQLIWDIYKVAFEKLPHRSSFSRSSVALSILGIEDELIKDPAFSKIKDYVQDDLDGTKHYELARSLADTYDQYQMYRPDWILAWDKMSALDFASYAQNKGAPGKVKDFLDKATSFNNAKKTVRDLLEANVWQAHLWTLLRSNMQARTQDDFIVEDENLKGEYLLDRSEIMQRLNTKLWEKDLDLERLPERVFIFGVSALPPMVIEFLQALGQVSQVYLMLLNPCKEYWGDLSDTFKEDFETFRKLVLTQNTKLDFKVQAKLLESKADPEVYKEDFYVENEEYGGAERVDGNQLLLSLGKQGRDNLSLLFNLNPLPNFITCFVDHEPQNLLGYLQQDLLSLKEAGDKIDLKVQDHSLEIHRCHTKRREVEVLRDCILRRFKEASEKGESLLARDIVVMVPTINEYAPYITSVFGSSCGTNLEIPFAISDRTTLESSPVANALLDLLDLSSKPITVAQVLDLLSVESIAKRFKIASEDVEVIGMWLEENAVFWGLNDEDTKKEAEISIPGSLRHGLDRMILGTMLGDDTKALCYSEIEGQDATLLGNLNEFIEALIKLQTIFIPNLSEDAASWRTLLFDHIQKRFFDDDEDTVSQFKTIEEAILELIEVSKNLKLKPKIKLPVFRAILAQALDSARDFTPYLKDKINFCSLIPMRAVPFKHIFIMGLNDLDFPRKERMPGFNLMGISGLSRRGDRSRGFEDRFLFLEALLSARESITFSYIGESPNSKQELMPSSVISELLDYIADNFTIEGSDSRASLEAHLIYKEHMSAYHEDNYSTLNGHYPSFDVSNFISIKEFGQQEFSYLGQYQNLALKYPLIIETLKKEGLKLNLKDLISFLKNPARNFLTQVLGFSLDSFTDSSVREVEPFELDNLTFSSYLETLTKLEDSEVEGFLELEKERGYLPYSVFGESACAQLLESRDIILKSLKDNAHLSSFAKIKEQAFNPHDFVIPIKFGDEELNVQVLLKGFAKTTPIILDAYKKDSTGKKDQKDSEDHDELKRASFAFSLLGEALAQYCLHQKVQEVHLISKEGTFFTLEALSESELQEFTKKALYFYTLGRLMPLAAPQRMLELYDPEKDFQNDPLAYEREACFLFGNYQTILNDDRLQEMFVKVWEFYQELKAKISVK